MLKRFVGLGFVDVLAPVQAELILDSYGVKDILFLKNIEDDTYFPYEVPGVAISILETTKTQFVRESGDAFFSCVVKPSVKQMLVDSFSAELKLSHSDFPSIVHPLTARSLTSTIECGVMVEPSVDIGPYAYIGSFVQIKRSVLVSHHSKIGEWSTINPGVTICSQVELGAGCLVGAGAVIIDKIKVGAGTYIGAGSVVNRDLPAGVIAFGNPCRVQRDNDVYQIK